ncbi:MAG: hypothetical protein HY856_04740 [Burkholderiales bacterium]|nr:hypothetical protein [Burkholderiales bacterium]
MPGPSLHPCARREQLRRPSLLALGVAVGGLLAACGGGGGGDGDDAIGGGGGGFTATCNTAAYAPGAVELPEAAVLATYAGTYAGDEGHYDNSGSFIKSASATLVVAADGQLTYKGVAYVPTSVCIDKVAGPMGKLVYVLVGTSGHFDVADRVDPTLGQAWGVSPVDGTTIFTNGRK